MVNNRIYYPIQQVAIRPQGVAVYYPVRGLQSVGMTTNFNLAQVFQIGQLSIYENIEEIPDVQMTLSKVLDGNVLISCLSTADAANPTLAARAICRCNPNLTIYNETETSAVGTPIGQVECSGMYLNSVRFSFPRDGNFTEEVTLVGNEKLWQDDSRIVNTTDAAYFNIAVVGTTGHFAGEDNPAGYGNVNRRQHLILSSSTGTTDVNTACNDINCTVLPQEVAGVGSIGLNVLTSDTRAHLTNINVSANLNREDITELGKRAPYFRTPTFPIEVTTEISITATSGDMISASETGILSNAVWACASESGNLTHRTIRIATCEGTRIYCGLKNKLASVNYTGGDATGGHVEVSYTYRTFNDMTIMHSGEVGLTDTTNAKNFWSSGSTYLRN